VQAKFDGKSVSIMNLTPHSVVVLRDDAKGDIVGNTGFGSAAKEGKFTLVAEYKPTGKVARAAQKDELQGNLEIEGHKVPLIKTAFGQPTDLPDLEEGTMYIVSILTAQAAKAAGRKGDDLIITSDPVRDAAGKIIGCRKFAVA
jgi:NAD(P)H-dependent flavin oxidoreductase YrpB (nitropropane dioxygenase family)